MVLGSKIVDNVDVSHHSVQKSREFLSSYADVPGNTPNVLIYKTDGMVQVEGQRVERHPSAMLSLRQPRLHEALSQQIAYTYTENMITFSYPPTTIYKVW